MKLFRAPKATQLNNAGWVLFQEKQWKDELIINMGVDKTLKACHKANMSSTACVTVLIVPTELF